MKKVAQAIVHGQDTEAKEQPETSLAKHTGGRKWIELCLDFYKVVYIAKYHVQVNDSQDHWLQNCTGKNSEGLPMNFLYTRNSSMQGYKYALVIKEDMSSYGWLLACIDPDVENAA